jgi:hypothetical protein
MKKIANSISLMPTNGGQKIVLYIEAVTPSFDQVNSYFDYLEELINEQKYHIIIDLSKSDIPCLEVRQLLKKRFKKIKEFTLSYNVYVGTNGFIKIAVKFIAAAVGIKEFRLFNSIEDAHQNILNKF